MKSVASILQQIDENCDIKAVRATIADLIEDHLQALKDSLGYWEKFHFANAIACLAWNINTRHQPTTAWLRVCLANIEKALIPENQRDENYTPREHQFEALTHEQFIDDLNTLRQMSSS